MKKRLQWFVGIVLGVMIGGILIVYGAAMAEHVELPVEKVVSQGTVLMVDAEGQMLILQKENGKKVSLEVTQETRLFLNGEPRGVELLEQMEAGRTVVISQHYTNDAGMQEAIRLEVIRLK
jgi:hypothetical protein